MFYFICSLVNCFSKCFSVYTYSFEFILLVHLLLRLPSLHLAPRFTLWLYVVCLMFVFTLVFTFFSLPVIILQLSSPLIYECVFSHHHNTDTRPPPPTTTTQYTRDTVCAPLKGISFKESKIHCKGIFFKIITLRVSCSR